MKNNNDLINGKEMIKALEDLEEEKGISKDLMLESIEVALVTAYKRNFDCLEENVKIVMDKKTGESHVYMLKEVVETVEDNNLQITLEDAKKISKKLEIGDNAEIEIIPRNFGRIAAQTAKQVIIQKIREASRDVLFDEFSERKGEIISGIIQKAEGGTVVIDLGKLEGIMLVKEQVPTEVYRVNDKIKVYILDVVRGIKGTPQVMVSRVNSNFVKRLFELEIPEIDEGLIEIRSVSREPGSRSKVAVYSQNENIDPVGSCVGQKGIRIQNIISELNQEKIDVIEWNEDIATYISSALLPARVLAVDVKEEERFAQVIVADDQFSLAIGKGGQNVKLAARLINWKIDIKSESQFREMIMKEGAVEATEVLEETTIENVEEEELQLNDEIIGTEEVASEEFEINDSEIIREEQAEEPKKKTTRKTTKKADEEKAEEPKKKTTRKTTKKADEEQVEEPKKKTT
ncbi:MAG: transcription termination factor NusA [Clostridia bacterium]|nr:transcription termination factor NusA [Clostridia bacterium]